MRHIFGDGYSCEIKLKRNALGKGAGSKSAEAKGKRNEHEASRHPKKGAAKLSPRSSNKTVAKPVKSRPKMVRIDANTGKRID